MASGLLRPVRRGQLPIRLTQNLLPDTLVGRSHEGQAAAACGTSVAGQHRAESSDAGPGQGRGRGRGQALVGRFPDSSGQPGAPASQRGRSPAGGGPPPGPRVPREGGPGPGRGRSLWRAGEQQGQQGRRQRPEGAGPGAGTWGRGAGQGVQQRRPTGRVRPGELLPGEQAAGRFDDPEEGELVPSQRGRRGRRASVPGQGQKSGGPRPRTEPQGEGMPPRQAVSPSRGPRGRLQFDEDEEEAEEGSLIHARSSSRDRARSQRPDTEWQGFRTPQQEQELRDSLQRVREALREELSDKMRPGPWSLDVHPDEGPIPEPWEVDAELERDMKLELMDPQLIMDIGGPPNPRKPVPNMGPEELLEHFKPQIMQTLGIEGNEEAWEKAIEGQAEAALAMSKMEGQVKSRDIWGEIEEVQALADELMPKDHPMRAHIDMSIQMMNSNSSYTLDKKLYQVRHLVHTLTQPLPKRLQKRGLLGMHMDT